MDYKILLIFIPLIIGNLLGFLFKPNKWYFDLKKNINPSPYVFMIAWTILYIAIGISYYIALKNRGVNYWILPITHLIFNFLYTPVLFGLNDLYLSTIIISLTLITAIMVVYQFYYIDKTKIAYKLLIPYIGWLLFAFYLNMSIFLLNRDKKGFLHYLFDIK